MIFAGSFLSPVVIQTPGLIPPATRIINSVQWGEDVTLSVEDPGFDCAILLVIKRSADLTEPDLQQSYERTSDDGDIVMSFSGTDFRKYLMPGIYRFQVIRIINTESPPLQYQFSPEGTIEIYESAGSLQVPEGDGEAGSSNVARVSYPPTDMYLSGSTTADQVFGFYRVPAGTALKITKIAVVTQTPPSGADLVLKLVDGDDGDVVTSITLPDGDGVVEVDVDDVVVSAGSVLRCMVVSTGTDVAAEGVQVRVHLST